MDEDDATLAALTTELAERPDDHALYLKLGDHYAAIGKAESAIVQYYAALHLDPRSHAAHYKLSLVLSKLGRTDAAILHCQKAFAARRSSGYAYDLAKLLIGKKEYGAALLLLEEYLRKEQADASPRLYELLVKTLVAGRQYDATNKVLEKAALDKVPLTAATYYAAAVASLLSNRWEQAEENAIRAYDTVVPSNKRATLTEIDVLDQEFYSSLCGLMVAVPGSVWARYEVLRRFSRQHHRTKHLVVDDLFISLPFGSKYIIIPSGDPVDPRALSAFGAVRKVEIEAHYDKLKDFCESSAATGPYLIQMAVERTQEISKHFEGALAQSRGAVIVMEKASLRQRAHVLEALISANFQYTPSLGLIVASPTADLAHRAAPTPFVWPFASLPPARLKSTPRTINRAPFHSPELIKPDRELYEDIVRHKETGEPFSLVRLGDGEAWVLGYEDTSTPERVAYITNTWFGNHSVSAQDVSDIRLMLMDAVREADAIGVTNVDRPHTKFGIVGRHINHYGLWNGSAKFYHQNIHFRLEELGFLASILQDTDVVSVVSPRNIDVLLKRFGVKHVVKYPIPEEVRYASVKESVSRHYPDRFSEIMEQISVPYPGSIFLIGGGVLGKIYANAVKHSGGIALDIGGVLDLWSGHRRVRQALVNRAEGSPIFRSPPEPA